MEINEGSSRDEFDGVARLIGVARKRFSEKFDITRFDSLVAMLDEKTKDPTIVAKFPYYGVYEFTTAILYTISDPLVGTESNVTESLNRVQHSDRYTIVASQAWDVVPLINKIRPLLEGANLDSNAEKLIYIPLFFLLSHEAITLQYRNLFLSVLSAAVELFEVYVTEDKAILEDTLKRINLSPKELEMLESIGRITISIVDRLGLRQLFLKYINSLYH